MDWYLDSAKASDASLLRSEIQSYLLRHAASDADIPAAILAVSELLANAVRHATGPAWVSIDWSEREPRLTVRDLGPGFQLGEVGLPEDPFAGGGRGLFLTDRVARDLEVATRERGGASVSVTLPVARVERERVSPVRRATAGLPTAEEANDDGLFGRESFLRALVVELAQTVELSHGPDASAAAIAQVGTDVGTRMEEEYRRARGIVDRLTTTQIADLYVQLKRGIGGGFYVVEASEHRIVLGNTACPFGPVVRQAPQLCWMTSSVFGGIAARNTDANHIDVRLEERIAVGDHQCRVVVSLRPTDDDPSSDRYSAQAPIDGTSTSANDAEA
jgi:anti-sigma regulatory factor (Ser/Thr protein kinase)/predicted ArsR family transcriptional regulator